MDKPLREIIKDIDDSFQESFYSIRKGEDIWDSWAMKWIPLKVSLERHLKEILMFVTVLIYSYWHNRNELLQAYIKSSVGNISHKKQVYESGRNIKDIINFNNRCTKEQELAMKNNISRHLIELEEGRYEYIAGRKVITKIEEEKIKEKKTKETSKTRKISI